MSASADGAIGLPGPDGKEEMIDRPMVLQVCGGEGRAQ